MPEKEFEPVPLFLIMAQGKDDVTISAAKPAWFVVVISEDAAAREAAVKFCDHLVELFWARYEFNVSWWQLGDLSVEHSASEAAIKAVQADLIIVATTPGRDLPAVLREWVEGWVGRRGDREGALVGLTDPGAGQNGRSAEKYVYLRNAAHRAGMDYLTEIPQSISSRSIPDSLDSYSRRADKVTSVLDGILQQKAPPPQMLS